VAARHSATGTRPSTARCSPGSDWPGTYPDGVDDEGDPIGYMVLPRGTPVVTSDGVEIGRVHRVQDNEREHIFDGLVVKGPAGNVFVDAPEVERITERRVTLNIDAAAAQDLPEHRGWRGRLEWRARRRVDRVKRNFPSR
jgi:PRC-barrel domain protein